MQNVSCPGCGAPVQFRSHAAVMAVCDFCRTTVVKDGDAVRDLGKMSAVLEDYSRIQIGTSGRYGERGFTVIGRIQLRYAAGMWNEWYLLFDDGAAGWLGDSSGLYVLTTEQPLPARWPAFDAIHPGQAVDTGAGVFTAAERRVADCIGGQGELPFAVGAGWQARVADLRHGARFATLDYSDGERPQLFIGAAVTLEGLQCQLLRDDDTIRAAAGRYRGRVDALACPSCGAAVNYLPGSAANLVCPSCHTPIDAATPQARVLAKGEAQERISLTLPLGASATIDGKAYRLIGAMVRADDEDSRWTEYLLYSAAAGFLWLVETDDGWSRTQVLPEWPEPGGPQADAVMLDKARFALDVRYPARVVYAAGAFNWRVQAGDTVQVAEYAHGQTRLAAEATDEELTWSRSVPVAFDQVRGWFAMGGPAPARPDGKRRNNATASRFLWWMLGLNAIPLLFNFGGTILWLVAGALVLVLPTALFHPDE